MAIVIRAAKIEDLPQARAIFAHYVLNTVVNFLHNVPSSESFQAKYEDIAKRQLPYIVAVEHASSDKEEVVVGYAYATGFRGTSLGYAHTVEMSLFCHPEHTNRGIGGKLISELLNQLRQTKHLTRETGYESAPLEAEVQKVMAVMAVDDTGRDQGLGLRDWYKKWGFEEVGRLKKVGHKKGRE